MMLIRSLNERGIMQKVSDSFIFCDPVRMIKVSLSCFDPVRKKKLLFVF